MGVAWGSFSRLALSADQENRFQNPRKSLDTGNPHLNDQTPC